MLSWLYSKEGYNFVKSGLYIDYFFKRTIYTLWKQLSVYLGIIFLEKFIIDNLVKKVTEKLIFNYNHLLNTTKITSSSQLKLLLFCLILFFTVLICYNFLY